MYFTQIEQEHKESSKHSVFNKQQQTRMRTI